MTNETKHTPGPWFLDDGNIIRATVDEVEICHVTYSPLGLQHGNNRTREMTHEEYEANARLIAAAPDLLEAAKIGLEVVKEMIKDAGPCEHDVNVCVCGYISYANQIESAIAKATGAK